MRILVINKRPPYVKTGAERVLWRIITSLCDRGHEVSVFCPTPAEGPRRTYPNIDFHYVPTKGKANQSMIEFFVRGIRYYPKVYKEVSPGLVYDNASPFAFHLAHIYGEAQRVTKVHAVYRRLAFSCKGHPVVKLGTAVGDELYRLFDGEVVITNSLSTGIRASMLFNKDTNRIVANPLGIDSENFQFSPSPGRKHVLSLSELRERKNIDMLLKAWSKVEARTEGARLTVAGDGPERERLESLANELDLDTVSFEGWVEEERKHELLRAASVFALPTRYEGFGLANLEAMASGCAVVSTDTWGVRDYIEDGTNGCLIPVGDTSILADVLTSLLRSPEEVKRLATAGRQTAESYSIDKSIEREVTFLEEIYAQKSQEGDRVLRGKESN